MIGPCPTTLYYVNVHGCVKAENWSALENARGMKNPRVIVKGM
jgi:hypothetical protein